MLVTDLGLISYDEAHTLQQGLVQQKVDHGVPDEFCLLCEHPSVFTLGKRGGEEFLQIQKEFLKQKNIDLVQTKRGGVVTYHGPGQLILYPIVSLRALKISVKDFVHLLEEVMIRTAGDFGVILNRDERNAGVWTGNSKVGFIGLAIRKGVTCHGLSLNVNLDLEPFSWINPCGLIGVGMSSLKQEIGQDLEMARVKTTLTDHFCSLLDCSKEQTDLKTLQKGLELNR